MRIMFTDLSVTPVLHHLSNLELNKVHEDGFGEVFKSIRRRQVRDQTPLLIQQVQYLMSFGCDVALDTCNFDKVSVV